MKSKLSPEPIKTFSVGVPYGDYAVARLVADACGTESMPALCSSGYADALVAP
jgi:hypothetical protein